LAIIADTENTQFVESTGTRVELDESDNFESENSILRRSHDFSRLLISLISLEDSFAAETIENFTSKI